MDQQEYARTSAAFLRFADEEARDRSALYDELARGAASDPLVIAFLLTLRKEKRQPNLLFAATRLLFGTPSGWCQFRHVLRENEDAIRAIMLKRSTQTNEPARCATLLPVLARLPQPLALIEVGASAGLCLMADRYGYDYRRGLVRPSVDQLDPPVFSCVVNATTPVPTAPPRVTWRAGLDLDPVDISDPNQAAWLEALVWPEQSDRLAKLRIAMRIAAENKPRIVEGDLRTDLARLDSGLAGLTSNKVPAALKGRPSPSRSHRHAFDAAEPGADRKECKQGAGDLADIASHARASGRYREREHRRKHVE